MFIEQATPETKILRFSSPWDFAQYAADNPNARSDGGSWGCGNITNEEAEQQLRTGDLSAVADAEKMLEDFSVGIERDRTEWELSVVGAFAAVPEYLTGEPLAMYDQIHHNDDRAPVRIVVNTTTSAGIPAHVMRRRGVAILALAMKLAELRPVSIQVINGIDDKASRRNAIFVSLDLPTAPLDLAHASFALSGVAWTRRIGYGLMNKHGGNGGWPWSLYPCGEAESKKHEQKAREAFKLAETDIYLPPAGLHSPEVENPRAFIQNTLNKYLPE